MPKLILVSNRIPWTIQVKKGLAELVPSSGGLATALAGTHARGETLSIGFAGPGVIKETTGLDIPPNYHNAYQALSRGHIQGIWDRREIRSNLVQSLQTMGGRNLYYR